MYYVIFKEKRVRVGFTKEIPAESNAKYNLLWLKVMDSFNLFCFFTSEETLA
jgi:hypothetical protein